MKKIFSMLKPLILALFLTVGLSYAFATWTGPGSTPPVCETNPTSPDYRLGCVAPINVGSIAQLKSGPLSLVSLFVNSLTIPTGSPSAGKILTAVDGTGLASWQDAGGGVSRIIAGSGITVSPVTGTGNVTVSADYNTVQKRVSGSCPTGQAIVSIGGNGDVVCSLAPNIRQISCSTGSNSSLCTLVCNSLNEVIEYTGGCAHYSMQTSFQIACYSNYPQNATGYAKCLRQI